jgi:GH35 family endo-1,4-beta-xylanase
MMAPALVPAVASLAAASTLAAPATAAAGALPAPGDLAAAPPVLAQADPAAAADQAAADTPATPAPIRERKRNDLYAPSPTRPQSGVATGFYRAYGRTITAFELEQGVRLGEMAADPPAPRSTEARAGIGVGSSTWRVLAAGLLVAALALVALLMAPRVATAAVPDQFLGITTEDAYTGKDAYAQQQLRAQRAAGFTVARQVFRWNEVEWGDDRFDFSATDRFIRNAAIAGMRVMPLLQGEPTWPSSRPKRDKSRNLFPPKNPATLGGFGSALAQRYGPNGTFWAANPQLPPMPVTSWQIWNEPNFPVYWGGKPNAKAYARMVIAAAAGIRAVDPNAYIVSAGLPDSKLGQNPVTFARTMLKAGAGASLNAIGIHPYAATPAQVLALTRKLRKAMNGAGATNLDLWVTEIGWAAGGPKTKHRTVSASQQGPTIVNAITKLAANREALRLRGIVYFAWRDSTVYKGGKDFWGLHTGLLDRKGKPKPAMKVVSKALRGL